MSLSRKTLIIASLALGGLVALLYVALANILSNGAQDEMVVSYVMVSIIVVGGGFFLVTLLLMNQLVLTRLARFNAAIRGIGGSGDFSRRLEIDGRDELAGLALEINSMLRDLQESRGVRRQDGFTSGPPTDPSSGVAIELFRETFWAAPVSLAICTVDGERCREVNERFLNLVGLSREQVIGRRFADLEIWAEASMRERWLRLMAEKQPAREFECRLHNRAGENRETLASVEWLKLADEPCFLFAACDITERLKQEIQLRHTQRIEAIGQMAAGFAHDFNNILAVVQGYTSLLLSDKALDLHANKALKEVSAATERAANLTRQLLTFSRKQIMQPKTLDLNRLLQGLENTLHRLLGESSAVKFNLSPDALPVRADLAMIEQAVVSLAVNARECMPRGGQFSVSTSSAQFTPADLRQKPEAQAGRFTCITVSDTGCGFEPGSLKRIFEPFFSAKGSGKGSGLGLATVYGIVKQHNGWIEVSSQLGQGTIFKLYLPIETATPAAKTPPLGTRGGKERILLVEDEPGLCTMVEGILRRYGYNVTTAPNGVDAIQIWKQQKGQFDLLLTDMVMPEGLTGRQLAEKLKAQNPELKVIYSSGYSADLVTDDGLELSEGLNFLQKPYHPQKLAQTVRSCLDSVEKPMLAEAVA